jgi:hypothetical protein
MVVVAVGVAVAVGVTVVLGVGAGWHPDSKAIVKLEKKHHCLRDVFLEGIWALRSKRAAVFGKCLGIKLMGLLISSAIYLFAAYLD